MLRLLSHMAPGVQRGKSGQAVVRQDEVKGLLVRERLEAGQRVHPQELAPQAGPPQTQCRQLVIRQGIFKMQDAQGLV